MKSVFHEQIHYCDYYRHCRQIPCPDARTNYQKNHDFKLNVKVDSQFHYLVQIRNPIQAIASWYTAELKHRHKNRIGEGDLKRGIKLNVLKDSYIFWRFFLAKSMIYWRRFAKKWILNPPVAPNILVRYEDLVDNPVEVLLGASRFINNDEDFELFLIEEVVMEQNIAKTRDISEFKYYDRDLFWRIENSLTEYYKNIGIPRIT